MNKAHFLLMGIVIGAFAFRAEAAEESKPAPLYVDAQAIIDRFSSITAEDMEMLRSKKILFGSASFGMNMRGGLKDLAKQDKKYDWPMPLHNLGKMNTASFRGVVWKDDGIEVDIPPSVFSIMNFVHFAVNAYPSTKRVDDLDALIRREPCHFGKAVDAAMVFYDNNHQGASSFEHYAKTMDALQADFPKVKFIYCAAGFMGPKRSKENENAHAFSELLRARYKGKAPLYDMGKILSDDFRCGHVYCPEYSSDPAEIHPNLPAGEIMLAKGFILVLRDAFRAPSAPGEVLTPVKTSEIAAPAFDTISDDHPDALAVQAILDANKLSNQWSWKTISVVERGRIVKLYLKEINVTNLTKSIGALTELRVLHLYGDRKRSLRFLKTIDPAIGDCTKLEELLLNHNDLTALPDTIINLTNLKFLSLADNRLEDLSQPVRDWARRLDPKGLEMQNGPAK